MKVSATRHQLFHAKTKRLRITVDIVSAVIIILFVALFLFRSSQVMHYRWNWKPVVASFFNPRGILLKGFLTTIRLSIWSSIIAFFIGTVVGVGRLVRNRFFRMLSGLYVSLIRNLPPLVLVFIFYFFFSSQLLDPLGIDQAARNASPLVQRILALFLSKPARLTAFLSAVITLGIYEGSYIAEIIQSGIRSVDKGQWEAGYSLGLSSFDRTRLIILPQAARNALPALTGQFISTMKDSSIVSVISIAELTFQGMELTASTYRTLEIWSAVTLLYFLLTFTASILSSRIESGLRKRFAD